MSIKISALPTASKPLSGKELVVVNQGGSTKTASLSDFKSYVGGTEWTLLSSNWQNTYTGFNSASANFASKNVINTFTVGQNIIGPLSAVTISLSGGLLITGDGIHGVRINNLSSPLSGNNNFIVGFDSGKFNTLGSNNNFMGLSSGYSNTTGSDNNFIGSSSGLGNTEGTDNNFIGSRSGQSNTTGFYNNFIGTNSGNSNITGYGNNFFGSNSGRSTNSGSSNIFIGGSSGLFNTIGNSNVFVGITSGLKNTSGDQNIFIGDNSGLNNTIGSNNVMIGKSTGSSASPLNSLSGCIVLGSEAKVNASNQLSMGSTNYPLLTSSIGIATGTFLNIIVNGQPLKIQLYS